MPSQQQKTEPRQQPDDQTRDERAATNDSHEMPCPVCGTPMPDLKGGKATICSVCGFKDSCCY
jgi:membrane protease subunit (stomatin/prohibitin family)